MKMARFLILFIALGAFVYTQTAEAGLINYKRRSENYEGNSSANDGKSQTSRARAGRRVYDEKSLAKWMQKLPRVRNRKERKYDINRDGRLQTAEVKVFLRDVIETVNEKGGYRVDSDVVREYDKNRDGVINSYEVGLIRDHTR